MGKEKLKPSNLWERGKEGLEGSTVLHVESNVNPDRGAAGREEETSKIAARHSSA